MLRAYALFFQTNHSENGNYIVYMNRVAQENNPLLCVEIGSWDNTPYEDGKFTVCKKNDIGDTFHYRFVCDRFISDRKSFLSSFYHKNPNII